MNTNIKQLLEHYPDGITTVNDAAQAMSHLHMHSLLWHMDDDPRQCGYTEEEGHVLNAMSDMLWKIACENFPLQEGQTSDTPMWEGLIDGLLTSNGIMAFRCGNEDGSDVIVSMHGHATKVARTEWKRVLAEACGEREEDYDENKALVWLTAQQKWMLISQAENQPIS